MPWTKLIDSAYIDHTVSILSTRTAKDPTIQFELVYKRKDGSAIPTLDTHSIFFSNGGLNTT